MDTDTIKQLNQLNANFYTTVAGSFSESRNSAWEGWQQLAKYIKPKNILDLGCGNGRFAEFLNIKFPETKFNYLGIDNSQELLKIAKSKLKYKFANINLVESLIDNSLAEKLDHEKYDLIIAMGLMHHIPSFKLRKELTKKLANLLAADGNLILAFWQFHKSERLMRKIINPKLVDINTENLEKNDYIIDWQRGKTAYRYCHSFTEQEIKELVKESGLELVAKFNADGKEKLNQYVILKKISS